MHDVQLIRLFSLLVFLQCFTATTSAYEKATRIPLLGCRGHFAASGDARYIEVRNESSVKDHQELIIEIKNVPLRPGTVLVVYVSDEVMGNITLDSKQGGTLKLSSEDRKFVPKLHYGTNIMITKVDGRLVIR